MIDVKKALLIAAFSQAGHTADLESYPIIIRCQDSVAESNQKIAVGINLLTNESILFYQTKHMEDADVVVTHNSNGINSGAQVHIESSARGRFMPDIEEIDLKIKASAVHVTRVTQYGNFTLNLTKSQDTTKALALTYSSGIDAFPETQASNELRFTDVTCTISGM